MRKPTIKQYSKRVVSAMVLAWFAGIAFGMGVIIWQMIRAPDAVSLDGLLTYIGAPMGCGIAGYLAKSAFENREKIKAKYNISNPLILSCYYCSATPGRILS